MFAAAKTLVASASAGSKGSESRGAHVDKQVAGVVFAFAQDHLTQAEASLGPGAFTLDVMVLLTVAMSVAYSLSVCNM
jgi:hypothetical protein